MNLPRRNIIIALLIGIVLLPVPLLGDFHIESALLISLVGCFWAGWSACRKWSPQVDGQRIASLLATLYIVGLPLFIYALVTDCLNLHGMGFWILYPVPSVFLGYSLGRLLRKWAINYRRWLITAILLFIAVGVLLIEFFNFPQVYFFNHVWGGWPGPIYDETVTVSWSLVFYRGLTLAWAGLLWMLPQFDSSRRAKAVVISCAVLLVIGYSQLAEMGVITPRSYLKSQLSGFRETSHFKLYYDEHSYSDSEIAFYAAEHEFYYQQLTERLNLDKSAQKIESYLYAHPWQKKDLVGAKFTSYVPVWLNRDQLHIAKPQLEGSLKHELVHVLSKEFGNALFNASWSIGLVEGLAVALAQDESSVSTINQIVVAEKPYPTANEMQFALSPLGFYGGRSAVNYTQSGSFVQYLLNKYSANNFKQAYKTGVFEEAYPISFDSLIAGWHQALDTVRVDSADKAVASRLYSFPSLFEQACPHVQSDFARYWDHYQYAMAVQDTSQALYNLNKTLEVAPQALPVKSRWAFLNLQTGHIESVQQAAAKTDTLVDALLLYADAFALTGEMNKATEYVAEAEKRLMGNPDSLLQEALLMRKDLDQWKYYREIIYHNQAVSDSIFKILTPRTQVKAMNRAIENEQWPLLERYAEAAVQDTVNTNYFDTYLKLVKWLALNDQMDVAGMWLAKLQTSPLRKRYQERLLQAQRWVNWLEGG